ncbi:MAG: DUF4389 domain-containing protein [Pseudomonadota bacterium]
MTPHPPATTPEHEDAAPGQRPFLRGLYMLLFVLLFALAETLLTIIAVLQFLWLVFTGAPNSQVRLFGHGLSQWMAAVGEFQACETEDKPFPFAPWPGDD